MPSPKQPAGKGILIALVPWVVFTLAVNHADLKVAAVIAVGAALGVCLNTTRRGARPKLLELAAVATFIGFTVVAFAADPSVTHWLVRYARAVASGALALLVFVSLAFDPFTAEYARESVPRELWHSPRFLDTNRRLTAMWGGIFLAMTASHVIAGAVDEHTTNIICNWVIPIALILWGAKRSGSDHTRPVGQSA